MDKISVHIAAELMNGLVEGRNDLLLTGVSTDTRKISGGELFFALKGENSDGHSFVSKAFENGAAGAVISDRNSVGVLPEGKAIVVVDDTLQALQQLAKGYLAQKKDLIKFGITGSVGKTGTKELLYACLKGKYKTARNAGNFNNHIGMPLTAMSVNSEHQAAVFEMGMGDFGEIHLLADIGRPDIAILTTIGVSHISALGSRENILKAKLEITDFFDETGCLVVNYDNDLISAYDWESQKYKVIKVGKTSGCDFRIVEAKAIGEYGSELELEISGKVYAFEIPMPGLHHTQNAALAIAAAVTAGVEPELIEETIKTCEQTEKRLIIKNSSEGIKVIDDSYNASPESMMAGIDVLMTASGDRKILFLADMLGMGEDTEKRHRLVGEYAGKRQVDGVYTVGTDARFISDEASKYIGREKTRHFETREELIENIDKLVQKGDAVLVKASRALGMEKVAEYLLAGR